MAKATKYKLGIGLAQVIITGEPVYITSIEDGVATVTRGNGSQTGLEYITTTFPVEQLETRYEQAKRVVEFEAFIEGLRIEQAEEADQKRYNLNKQQIDAIKRALPQAVNPSHGSDA